MTSAVDPGAKAGVFANLLGRLNAAGRIDRSCTTCAVYARAPSAAAFLHQAYLSLGAAVTYQRVLTA